MMIFAIKVTKKCFLVDCDNKTAEVGSETVRIVLPGVDLPGELSRSRFEALFFEIRFRGTRK
jgi:hypothetical protein